MRQDDDGRARCAPTATAPGGLRRLRRDRASSSCVSGSPRPARSSRRCCGSRSPRSPATSATRCPTARVLVGTEAVLHRIDTARRRGLRRLRPGAAGHPLPRRRTGAGAARAGRSPGRWASRGPRRGRGADPPARAPVVAAAVAGDVERWTSGEIARRRLLRYPPFAALAHISGARADELRRAPRSVPSASRSAVPSTAPGWPVRPIRRRSPMPWPRSNGPRAAYASRSTRSASDDPVASSEAAQRPLQPPSGPPVVTGDDGGAADCAGLLRSRPMAVSRTRRARAARKRKRRMDGPTTTSPTSSGAPSRRHGEVVPTAAPSTRRPSVIACSRVVAWRPLHPDQHRARLSILQRQQVQRRGHRLAAAQAPRRAHASWSVTPRSAERSRTGSPSEGQLAKPRAPVVDPPSCADRLCRLTRGSAGPRRRAPRARAAQSSGSVNGATTNLLAPASTNSSMRVGETVRGRPP